MDAIQHVEIQRSKKSIEELNIEVARLNITVDALVSVLIKKGLNESDLIAEIGHYTALVEEEKEKGEIFEVRLKGDKMMCPVCGIVFSVNREADWDGKRHLRCGTRIMPID
ncbi:MAG: hypothetical protein AAF226_02710 [Verrucomicrobiota bacterium]